MRGPVDLPPNLVSPLLSDLLNIRTLSLPLTAPTISIPNQFKIHLPIKSQDSVSVHQSHWFVTSTCSHCSQSLRFDKSLCFLPMAAAVGGSEESLSYKGMSSDNIKGLVLALSSSIFIGGSFIVKKKGLKKAGASGVRAGVQLALCRFRVSKFGHFYFHVYLVIYYVGG